MGSTWGMLTPIEQVQNVSLKNMVVGPSLCQDGANGLWELGSLSQARLRCTSWQASLAVLVCQLALPHNVEALIREGLLVEPALQHLLGHVCVPAIPHTDIICQAHKAPETPFLLQASNFLYPTLMNAAKCDLPAHADRSHCRAYIRLQAGTQSRSMSKHCHTPTTHTPAACEAHLKRDYSQLDIQC